MAAERILAGKRVLFLLLGGFDKRRFEAIRGCLSGAGASVYIASSARGDTLTSSDGQLTVRGDFSFALAAEERFDVLILEDDVTAKAVSSNPDALRLIELGVMLGELVVTVGWGALVLIGTGIATNRVIATIPEMERQLIDAGATLSGSPLGFSGNLMTACSDASMDLLCRDIIDYLMSDRTIII